MKKSLLRLLLPLSFGIALFSCTNGEFTIGKSIQPDRDVVWTTTNVFSVSSNTVTIDSIFQRCEYAVLGEFTDARYGTTKSDFITQFYCHDDFSFSGGIIDEEIDSVYLYLFFDDFYGDSTALAEATVYQLNEAPDAEKPYYTNIDIDDFCDRSLELGKSVYTVASSDNTWNDEYDYCIRVPIATSFGQQMYDDYKEHPEYFAGPQAFSDYMKGIYVTTRYGNGSFVYITSIELEMIYDYRYSTTDSTGATVYKDTIAASYFPSTKEMRQINTYTHPDLSAYMPIDTSDQCQYNYLYAPAGMYTPIRLDLPALYEPLAFTNINYARIKLTATDLDDSEWGMNPPDNLLLISEKEADNFLSGYHQPDKLYSFLSSYDESDTCFIFEVTPMIQKYVRHEDGNELGKDFKPYDRMLVIPVRQVKNSESTSLYLVPATEPQAVKIRSAQNTERPMLLEVVSSKQNN